MPDTVTHVPLNIEGALALAKALGIDSTSELSRRTGIERSYLSRILKGDRPAQASHVRALAQALKVAPVALLGCNDPLLTEAVTAAEAVA